MRLFVIFYFAISASLAWAYDGSKSAYIEHSKQFYAKAPMPEQLETVLLNGVDVRIATFRTPTGQKRGDALFLSGRTEFIEKNIPAYKALLARGFDVYTFDWRGQGLSQRETDTSEKGYIDSYETYVSDLESFVSNYLPAKVAGQTRVMVAHSMGGQISARYLIEHPKQFDYAAFSSPMMGLADNTWTNNTALSAMSMIGKGAECVPGREAVWASYLDSDACDMVLSQTFEAPANTQQSQNYSSDLSHLASADCWTLQNMKASPTHHVGLGCPTVDWVKSSFESIDSTAEQAARIETPTLIVGSENDQVVDFSSTQQVCNDMKDCCLINIPQAAHEILIEREGIQQQFWQAFDALLETKNARKMCP
ncbi:alpha/beta fold hydrolase [Echinimonas agarilytica]|uniref:Alpha/beta hydrolase n=1 Tax=Echinimonas agarilytica TaxID=1215918 RepID=A0AA41W7W6_9GAMM|nr:alpha/beta hydrolase [Echinimonas agarilytica]MCM2680835.1 alpha/beta hydrolase [Echinimonas agarilytica]